MTQIGTLLKRELSSRKKRNPRYSLRSFARDLGIEAATLQQAMSGKRRLTAANVRKILERLPIPMRERHALIQLLTFQEAATELEDHSFTQVAQMPSDLASDWLFYATLCAFELADFKSSVSWFARRLGVDKERMSSLLATTESCGLIDRSKEPWSKKNIRLTPAPDTRLEDLRKVHGACIEKALEYLMSEEKEAGIRFMTPETDTCLADFTGSTFSIDAARLPEALEYIKEFRRGLGEFLTGGPTRLSNDEVYRLNIQLFPVSKTRVKS